MDQPPREEGNEWLDLNLDDLFSSSIRKFGTLVGTISDVTAMQKLMDDETKYVENNMKVISRPPQKDTGKIVLFGKEIALEKAPYMCLLNKTLRHDTIVLCLKRERTITGSLQFIEVAIPAHMLVIGPHCTKYRDMFLTERLKDYRWISNPIRADLLQTFIDEDISDDDAARLDDIKTHVSTHFTPHNYKFTETVVAGALYRVWQPDREEEGFTVIDLREYSIHAAQLAALMLYTAPCLDTLLCSVATGMLSALPVQIVLDCAMIGWYLDTRYVLKCCCFFAQDTVDTQAFAMISELPDKFTTMKDVILPILRGFTMMREPYYTQLKSQEEIFSLVNKTRESVLRIVVANIEWFFGFEDVLHTIDGDMMKAIVLNDAVDISETELVLYILRWLAVRTELTLPGSKAIVEKKQDIIPMEIESSTSSSSSSSSSTTAVPEPCAALPESIVYNGTITAKSPCVLDRTEHPRNGCYLPLNMVLGLSGEMLWHSKGWSYSGFDPVFSLVCDFGLKVTRFTETCSRLVSNCHYIRLSGVNEKDDNLAEFIANSPVSEWLHDSVDTDVIYLRFEFSDHRAAACKHLLEHPIISPDGSKAEIAIVADSKVTPVKYPTICYARDHSIIEKSSCLDTYYFVNGNTNELVMGLPGSAFVGKPEDPDFQDMFARDVGTGDIAVALWDSGVPPEQYLYGNLHYVALYSHDSISMPDDQDIMAYFQPKYNVTVAKPVEIITIFNPPTVDCAHPFCAVKYLGFAAAKLRRTAYDYWKNRGSGSVSPDFSLAILNDPRKTLTLVPKSTPMDVSAPDFNGWKTPIYTGRTVWRGGDGLHKFLTAEDLSNVDFTRPDVLSLFYLVRWTQMSKNELSSWTEVLLQQVVKDSDPSKQPEKTRNVVDLLKCVLLTNIVDGIEDATILKILTDNGNECELIQLSTETVLYADTRRVLIVLPLRRTAQLTPMRFNHAFNAGNDPLLKKIQLYNYDILSNDVKDDIKTQLTRMGIHAWDAIAEDTAIPIATECGTLLCSIPWEDVKQLREQPLSLSKALFVDFRASLRSSTRPSNGNVVNHIKNTMLGCELFQWCAVLPEDATLTIENFYVSTAPHSTQVICMFSSAAMAYEALRKMKEHKRWKNRFTAELISLFTLKVQSDIKRLITTQAATFSWFSIKRTPTSTDNGEEYDETDTMEEENNSIRVCIPSRLTPAPEGVVPKLATLGRRTNTPSVFAGHSTHRTSDTVKVTGAPLKYSNITSWQLIQHIGLGFPIRIERQFNLNLGCTCIFLQYNVQLTEVECKRAEVETLKDFQLSVELCTHTFCQDRDLLVFEDYIPPSSMDFSDGIALSKRKAASISPSSNVCADKLVSPHEERFVLQVSNVSHDMNTIDLVKYLELGYPVKILRLTSYALLTSQFILYYELALKKKMSGSEAGRRLNTLATSDYMYVRILTPTALSEIAMCDYLEEINTAYSRHTIRNLNEDDQNIEEDTENDRPRKSAKTYKNQELAVKTDGHGNPAPEVFKDLPFPVEMRAKPIRLICEHLINHAPPPNTPSTSSTKAINHNNPNQIAERVRFEVAMLNIIGMIYAENSTDSLGFKSDFKKTFAPRIRSSGLRVYTIDKLMSVMKTN